MLRSERPAVGCGPSPGVGRGMGSSPGLADRPLTAPVVVACPCPRGLEDHAWARISPPAAQGGASVIADLEGHPPPAPDRGARAKDARNLRVHPGRSRQLLGRRHLDDPRPLVRTHRVARRRPDPLHRGQERLRPVVFVELEVDHHVPRVVHRPEDTVPADAGTGATGGVAVERLLPDVVTRYGMLDAKDDHAPEPPWGLGKEPLGSCLCLRRPQGSQNRRQPTSVPAPNRYTGSALSSRTAYTAISALVLASSFLRMLLTWCSTVRRLRKSCAAIWSLDSPRLTRRATSCSRRLRVAALADRAGTALPRLLSRAAARSAAGRAPSPARTASAVRASRTASSGLP